MALERPIVTVAAVEEHRRILSRRNAELVEALSRIDGSYNAWKLKLSKSLLTEYTQIQTSYKKITSLIKVFEKEREVFRAKAARAGLPQQLSVSRGGVADRKDEKLQPSPSFVPSPVSQFSSPRTPRCDVWVAPLSGLVGEEARRQKLTALQAAKDVKRTAVDNFMTPRALKPLERAPTFLGGVTPKAIQPSHSEKKLIPKGNNPCGSPPSSRSLKIGS